MYVVCGGSVSACADRRSFSAAAAASDGARAAVRVVRGGGESSLRPGVGRLCRRGDFAGRNSLLLGACRQDARDDGNGAAARGDDLCDRDFRCTGPASCPVHSDFADPASASLPRADGGGGAESCERLFSPESGMPDHSGARLGDAVRPALPAERRAGGSGLPRDAVPLVSRRKTAGGRRGRLLRRMGGGCILLFGVLCLMRGTLS